EAPDQAPAPEQAAPAAPATGEAKKPRERAPKEAKTKPDAAPAPTAAPAAAPTAGAPAPTESTKKKGRQPGTPPRRGKKLRGIRKNQAQKVARGGPVPLKGANQLLKGLKRAKFDETVEVHMSLGIDSTQSDQMIRGSVPLPHGVGKSVRVLVFCQGDNVARA